LDGARTGVARRAGGVSPPRVRRLGGLTPPARRHPSPERLTSTFVARTNHAAHSSRRNGGGHGGRRGPRARLLDRPLGRGPGGGGGGGPPGAAAAGRRRLAGPASGGQ